MKSIFTFLRSFFALGQLGLVLLLMAAAIFLGSAAALRNFSSFTQAWKRADTLVFLQDQVSSHLYEMQRYELYYTYAMEYEWPLEDELELAADQAAQLKASLDELASQKHFTPDQAHYQEEMAQVEQFRALLEAHLKSFNLAVQTYTAGDLETAQEQMVAAQQANDDLQAILYQLIASVEVDREAAAQGLPADISSALLGISIAILAMMILGLWGYRAISRLTQPLLDLTNAVIAIGGDQYRAELLGSALRQGGPPGRLARKLDAFTRVIEARHAGLKEEIAQLRQQFFEARRKRLKVYRQDRQAGGQP